jgi:hypothetical protein
MDGLKTRWQAVHSNEEIIFIGVISLELARLLVEVVQPLHS